MKAIQQHSGEKLPQSSKPTGDPVAEGSSQFCKIYFHRLNQMHKVKYQSDVSMFQQGGGGERFQVKEEVMHNGPAVLQKVPFCRNCSARISFAVVLMIVLRGSPSPSSM